MLDNAQSDNKPDKNSQWCEIYRTNIIYDNLNPNFHDTFILDYKFEEYQQLKFEVYDYDSETKSDFLGQVECSIGEIVR